MLTCGQSDVMLPCFLYIKNQSKEVMYIYISGGRSHAIYKHSWCSMILGGDIQYNAGYMYKKR